jgi:hypothetical protein
MMIYFDVYRLLLIIPARFLSFFSHHDHVKEDITVSKYDFIQIEEKISI